MELDSIGKYIRKFRLARKLRQEELAEQTGLSTNYIGMIERGEKFLLLNHLLQSQMYWMYLRICFSVM